MFVLKLPPFFPQLHSKGKRAAIAKQTCVSQKRVRSYIVLALVTLGFKRQVSFEYQDPTFKNGSTGPEPPLRGGGSVKKR